MKTVWGIKYDWAIDSGEHKSDCELFATKELAKKEFDKQVNEDKTVNYEGYADNPDFSVEESEFYWCIWRTRAYTENHSEIILVEMPISEA